VQPVLRQYAGSAGGCPETVEGAVEVEPYVPVGLQIGAVPSGGQMLGGPAPRGEGEMRMPIDADAGHVSVGELGPPYVRAGSVLLG
jgi:hypothetical protein